MKKIFVALTALALAGASVQTASAGGHHHGGCGNGWNTAAAVLGGVTAGVIIGQAVTPRPVYYAAPAPVYYPAPGYGYTYYAPVAPAPVVYAAPPPVVVYRPPVYVAPAPVVSVGVTYRW